MLIANEMTAAQLHAAYQAGQRIFTSLEIVSAEKRDPMNNRRPS
jgi:hypothetical protein